MLDQDDRADILRLLTSRRWAALAVLDGSLPLGAMTAFVTEPGCQGVLLLVSNLARHTRCLLSQGKAALVISDPDTGSGDPQQLQRITLQGRVVELRREDAEFDRCRALYLDKLPDSARLFGFADFRLLRLIPDAARFVGGFGRARSLDGATLQRCWEAEAGG